MHGKAPSNFRSSRPTEEHYFDEPLKSEFSGNRFSHLDDLSINASNSVHSSSADFFYDNDHRKMTMGRGVYLDESQPSKEQKSHNDDRLISRYVFYANFFFVLFIIHIHSVGWTWLYNYETPILE